MKTILLITTIGILAFTANAQESKPQTTPKDQNKTTMQQHDKNGKNNKGMKTDSTRRKNRTKSNEKNLKMDQYPSNKQGSSASPSEQQHLDSSFNNNHR